MYLALRSGTILVLMGVKFSWNTWEFSCKTVANILFAKKKPTKTRLEAKKYELQKQKNKNQLQE